MKVAQEAQVRLCAGLASGLPSRDFKEYWIHMNRTFITVAALVSCLAMNAAAQAPAAAAAPAGPAKIAVIGFQEAIAQTNDFQRRFADLQKKYDPKRQELKTLNDQITSLQKELQAQSA